MWGGCAPTGCRLPATASGAVAAPLCGGRTYRLGPGRQPGAGSGVVLGGLGVRHANEANLIVLPVGLRTSDSEKSPLLRDWWRL